ncbi:hypothetical protein CcI49_28075 [Frankia sp. CcI49]|nr:hypothetical protein CcI49_28075 [Frankia sp. CcI49]
MWVVVMVVGWPVGVWRWSPVVSWSAFSQWWVSGFQKGWWLVAVRVAGPVGVVMVMSTRCLVPVPVVGGWGVADAA